MGLDSVELLVEIEEEFDIQFTNIEAENMITVGKTFELVLVKLGLNPLLNEGKCLSQQCFYQLRRSIRKLTKNQELIIRPNDQINDLNISEFHKQWSKLSQDLKINLPQLEKPLWYQRANYAICFSAFFLLIWLSQSLLFFGLIIFIPFLFNQINQLFSRLNSEIPDITTRDLVNILMNSSIDNCTNQEVASKEIYHRLKKTIMNQIGVDWEEIKYNSNYALDLGVD